MTLTPNYLPFGLSPKIVIRNIPTVRATGSVALTGGASGSVDGITVNGVQIMSGAESFDTSLTQTAENVAKNINNNFTNPNYFAANNGTATVTITCPHNGETSNSLAVVSSTTTITTTDTNTSGGVGNAVQYTFESAQIAGSPTQDFTLTGGSFHLGVNDDFGYFTFTIDDHDNNMTDGTAKATPVIKQQWSVELSLGKTSATLNRWFYGKVIDVTVNKPLTGMTQLQVTCGGWGMITKNRYTSIKRFQDKTADGTTLDTTDTSAQVSELMKDIFQDNDHYVTEGLERATEITTTGVQTLDIKLADFQQTGQTWASAASTLAAWSNAYWGIDADRDVYLHCVGTQDSGFLFTNDLTGLDAQGWDADKIGYLVDAKPFTWSNTSDAGCFSVLHAFGGNSIQLDLESNPTANAILNMDSNWIAWKITPTQNNIEKIALSLNRTGLPAAGKAEFFIVGDNGSGAPNSEDVRAAGSIGEDILQNMPTSGNNWVEIGFNIKGGIPIDPLEELFIVMKLYGGASDTYGIENDTTTDTDYWTSSDGTNPWTAITGTSRVTFLYRVYTNRPITVTLEDLVSKRKCGVREIGFSMRQDVQVETIQEGLIQAAATLGKERRVYKNVIVTPVTDRIPMGKYCRVQESATGLDTQVDIIGVDGYFSADDASNMGIQTLTLTLQEIQG